ncbi:MAG: hypothetical protein FJ295_00065 [Planctomycetes bacterium]|nr:hypothetical protein [Planctomycetota bacterium]
MPATEQTWRDQKRLHSIFMASALGLLGATLWMLSADHNREWKRFQDQARDVEQANNEWTQLQFETDEQFREHEQLSLAWDLTRSQPVSDRDLEAFASELADQARRETDALRAVQPTAAAITPTSIEKIRKRNDELKDAAAAVLDALTDEGAASRRKAIDLREQVLNQLRTIASQVQFREKVTLDARKKRNADLDAAKANVDIAVRDGLSEARTRQLQLDADTIKADLDGITLNYQRLNDHRKALDSIVRRVTAGEDESKKKLDASKASLKSLESAYKQRDLAYINWVGPFPMPGKRLLTLPIIDAFQSPRKIDNLWSDDNTINYNFRYVRRFDRCTTCHQLMEKSMAGAADKPAFIRASNVDFRLDVPDRARREEVLKSTDDVEQQLYQLYGVRFAEQGLLSKDDVTVTLVRPESPAALATAGGDTTKLTGAGIRDALVASNVAQSVDSYPIRPGLATGDVITEIDGNAIRSRDQAERLLLQSVKWGSPLRLTVRRGVPNPFTSHPRLDLFVGSMSPHKLATFGCTTCHEGQGSSTSFQWASHTPDGVNDRKEWVQEHHWHDNAHWIFPMFARRFAESACLKCHHEVVELEASEKFPETPAPKVTHGYHLILKYGCFGCHEINGFDGPAKRMGPDMRLEPNFFAAAQQLKASVDFAGFDPQDRAWIDELIEHPERNEVRHRLYESLAKRNEGASPLSTTSQKLLPVLKDVEAPGVQRKAGPSLRFAGSKMDDQFLFDWIADPTHFRPSTRMPKFFSLHKHLDNEPHSKELAQKYEQIEILGIVEYLRQRSQPFEYLPAAAGITPSTRDDQIARGRVAFEERGCLACHTHKDFAEVARYRKTDQIVQGPDLSELADKFAEGRHAHGAQWLYSWIRQPSRYHVRTVMPDLYLDPIEKRDESGKVIEITDPVADIVTYLLDRPADSTQASWSPRGNQPSLKDRDTRKVLDELVRDNLREVFSVAASDRYLQSGIPDAMANDLKGAETELVAAADQKSLSEEQKLLYIGRKSIGKYGCFGCHDVPGFEDAKPIGTALADWGRKDSSKLAFEHITHYLEHGHGGGHAAGHHEAVHGPDDDQSAGAHADNGQDPDTVYYHHQIESGNRIGFLWQKLKEPRSYDFRKTENKRYNERLRMPQFPFNAHEREAVMAFVLGLVSDPPPAKYLFKPDASTAALIEGRKVLDKYNCAGCHLLAPQKWELGFAKDALQAPEFQGFPFMKTHFNNDSVQASLKVDHQGRRHSTVLGMPTVTDDDARPLVEDDQGDRLEGDGVYDPAKLTYRIDLLRPSLVNGAAYEVGVMPLAVSSAQLESRSPAEGGVLARYLLSSVTRREKLSNPAAKGSESWGWVPPPLVGEGEKVQSSWLHDFLLNPFPIRPAVVLRMPRFNMTSEEAASLARYFAAVDQVDYPYDLNNRRRTEYLARAESEYQSELRESDPQRKTTRLDDAMRIVTNNNYCVKCHIVNDFEPKGSERAKAPNLAKVYERLRPDYVRRWIANPKQLLPYTSMPQNIPFPAGIDKKLYHGDSVQQVDALVDLLMNFDEYAQRQSRIAPLVQQNPAPAAAGAGSASTTAPGAGAVQGQGSGQVSGQGGQSN